MNTFKNFRSANEKIDDYIGKAVLIKKFVLTNGIVTGSVSNVDLPMMSEGCTLPVESLISVSDGEEQHEIHSSSDLDEVWRHIYKMITGTETTSSAVEIAPYKGHDEAANSQKLLSKVRVAKPSAVSDDKKVVVNKGLAELLKELGKARREKDQDKIADLSAKIAELRAKPMTEAASQREIVIDEVNSIYEKVIGPVIDALLESYSSDDMNVITVQRDNDIYMLKNPTTDDLGDRKLVEEFRVLVSGQIRESELYISKSPDTIMYRDFIKVIDMLSKISNNVVIRNLYGTNNNGSIPASTIKYGSYIDATENEDQYQMWKRNSDTRRGTNEIVNATHNFSIIDKQDNGKLVANLYNSIMKTARTIYDNIGEIKVDKNLLMAYVNELSIKMMDLELGYRDILNSGDDDAKDAASSMLNDEINELVKQCRKLSIRVDGAGKLKDSVIPVNTVRAIVKEFGVKSINRDITLDDISDVLSEEDGFTAYDVVSCPTPASAIETYEDVIADDDRRKRFADIVGSVKNPAKWRALSDKISDESVINESEGQLVRDYRAVNKVSTMTNSDLILIEGVARKYTLGDVMLAVCDVIVKSYSDNIEVIGDKTVSDLLDRVAAVAGEVNQVFGGQSPTNSYY